MRLREADGEATWLQLWCNRNSKTGPVWCNPNWLVLTHLISDLMSVCIFRKRLNGFPQVWPVHDYRRRTGQCLQDLWQGLFGSISTWMRKMFSGYGSQGKGSPDMVQRCSMVFNVPGQKWHHRCHWAPGCALQVGLFCESPAATQWNSVGSPGVVFFKLQIWSQ